ncbi:MAG: hypothetical protein IT430_19760 [Phycisphaerales bacterium]|nr:hypothetical protein [Phycisphaerales bacterium]
MPTPREDQTDRPGGLNPAALSVTDTARTLTRVGGRPITEAMIERDIEDGAPTNGDGTINLVHYAAWLVKDLAERASANGGGRGD